MYKRFPMLRDQRRRDSSHPTRPEVLEKMTLSQRLSREVADWSEFARLPIFCSEYCFTLLIRLTRGSVAIATIYLTTLSYDGTFIAYIKAVRGWDDAFIAAMRVGLGPPGDENAEDRVCVF